MDGVGGRQEIVLAELVEHRMAWIFPRSIFRDMFVALLCQRMGV